MSPWVLLGELLSSVAKIFPRIWWCPVWMSGILCVRGKYVKKFGPGMVVWWPFWTTIETCSIVRQVLNIDVETITTKDDQSIIVSGIVIYRIEDYEKYLCENYEAESNIDEAVSACFRDVIVNKTWDEIQQSISKTDNMLTKKAALALDAFGIKIEKTRLTSMAKARVINLIGPWSGNSISSDY